MKKTISEIRKCVLTNGVQYTILMQHAGGREVIDIEKIRRDRVISRLLGWIPSDSALGDWNKR